MKMKNTFLFLALSTSFVVGCGDSEKKSSPPKETSQTLQDVGFKPGAAGPTARLDSLSDGLYRLREVKVLSTYEVADLDPNVRTTYKITMAGTQAVQDLGNKKKFDARLAALRRAMESTDPNLNQREPIVLLPMMKLPLTVRIRDAAVAFEQIRMLWVCLKTRGVCPKENYLSLGRSTNNDVINPSLYLSKKGYQPVGEDTETHLKALRSGRVANSPGSFWIEMESALTDETRTIVYIRLIYSADGKPREQDLVGNSDEESLQGPDAAP